MNVQPASFAPTHEQMLAWARGARTPYPAERTVAEVFAAQAARRPDAAAVIDDATRWTYRELDAYSNRIARHLLARGLAPGNLIGLPGVRSAGFVASALGVLKAGGAYVPLDMDEPAERQALRRRDCAIVLAPTETCSTESDAPLPGMGTPDSPAYVLYTSGSTGTPKGVVVPHCAITRLVCATDYIDFQPGDVVAFHSNLSFDASTLELWGPLLNGAALVVTATETVLSATSLATHLRTHQITTLWLTTSLFNQLAHESPAMFAGLRHLVFGGEAADPASVRLVLEHGHPFNLVNGYGPTETTTFACCHRIAQVEGERVPIGRPIANTDAFILDSTLAPSLEGELHVGGPGLALGYLGQPELTAERFIETPFGHLYKTGDLARWRPDGTIDYLGRADRQIKIRGFRIEPGEIEAAIRRHPEVLQCVATVQPAPSGGQILAAYYVGSVSADPLREFLRDKLPAQMVPGALTRLEALPLTPNGKLDYRALPAPVFERPSATVALPRTALEQTIAAAWKEALRLEEIGLDQGFFDLGGDSLLMVKMHGILRAQLTNDLPITKLFQFPTIRSLADHLAEQAGRSAAATSAQDRAQQQRAALARRRPVVPVKPR